MRSIADQFDIRTNPLTLHETGLSQIVDTFSDSYFQSGKLIFQAGSGVDNIYFQLSGRSSVQMPGEPVQQLFSCPAESPRIYGIVEALAGDDFGCSLTTASPCRFRIVATETMFSILKANPGAALDISTAIGRRYINMVRALN